MCLILRRDHAPVMVQRQCQERALRIATHRGERPAAGVSARLSRHSTILRRRQRFPIT
jgi:hypothetical protein